ncbi:MAG: hypothetical protein GY856_17020 [bacterium]|nr:hypothetical protein [bacterium]
MYELTKSMMRFSWAMSMLGVRQMTNVFSKDGWDNSTEAMNAVSVAAAGHMGDTVHSVYDAGDQFQSGMVDTAKRAFDGSWSDPGKLMNDAWDAVDRSWTTLKDGFSSEDEEEDES